MNDIFVKIPERIGILPSNKLFDKHPKIYKSISIIHSVINFTMVILPASSDINHIINGVYSDKEIPLVIMQLVRLFVYATIVSTSVLYKNVFYPDSYMDIKYNFYVIDTIVTKCNIKLKKRWRIPQFILLHVAFVLYIIYTLYIYNNVYPIEYLLIINWVHYNYVTESILAWNMLEHVRERFVILNNAIDDLQTTDTKHSISSLIEIHENLLKILRTYNKIFGSSVALRNLIFITEVLFTSLKLVTIPGMGIYLDLIDCMLDLVNNLLLFILY